MQTIIENLPEELKKVNNWVCWQGADKTPKNPRNGYNARSNDPKTWGTFKQACKACESFGFDGIGFVFDEKSEYFGVDLDKCIEKVDFCDEFVETLQSYAEISKSGTGLHIICKGKLPDGSRRKDNVEMYCTGRYFICTGNIYNAKYTDIKDCTETIKILHNKYLPKTIPTSELKKPTVVVDLSDYEIIDKARNCQTGQFFNLLYSGAWQGAYKSQSEADIALCNQLAFWTGRNAEQMDRIFRSSGLMRKKWDEKRGIDTYGNITIGKACAACVEIYEPKSSSDDTALAISFFKNGMIGESKRTKQYDMNDTGTAHRLYDKHGHILKYSYNRKKWYFWEGRTWVLDEMGEIKRLADEICEDLKQEAFTIEDEKLQEKALKFANRTANSSAKEAFIKECQHLKGIPAAPDDFDRYADYLNCLNGIVNLKNGELIPHDQNFMMSKICNSEYDITHTPPKMWLKFLDDITSGDKQLIDYIQKSVGYSLSGSNEEQCAYFLYGNGNNGKSTFLATIADLLGDYCSNAQPETLMLQGRVGSLGGGANSDIARLKSSRLVTIDENNQDMKLNEGLLKQLTGGGKITARFLYSEEFEYTPEFKIWVDTNHKPQIRGTDLGIWRRIKLIPFEVNIPKEKVDRYLKYKLRSEFPQILAWAVDGYMKWQQEGLGEPQSVIEATKEYKNEMDLVGTFSEQCIFIGNNSNNSIAANELYSVYVLWAKECNEFVMSRKKFGAEIAKKLPEKKRMSQGYVYTQIELTDYAKQLVGKQYRAEDFK